MNPQAVQAWLENRIGERSDVESAVVLMAVENTLVPSARWPQTLTQDRPLTVAAKAAFSAKQSVSGTDPVSGLRMLSHPILANGQVIGACALRLVQADAATPHLAVSAQGVSAKPVAGGVRPGVVPLGETEPSNNLHSNRTDALPQLNISALLRQALDQPDSAQAATVVVTELAVQLECERVSLGFVDRKNVRLVAVSHGGNLKKKLALSKSLCAVMNEAVDQAAAIQYPQTPEDQPRITLAASRHCDQENVGTTLCIPVVRAERIVGALLCERKTLIPFSDTEITALHEVAVSVCSVLDLKRTGEMSSGQRIWRRLSGRRVGDKSLGLKWHWIALGLLALCASAAFIPVQYRVTAPARLEARVQRSIAAPTDSFIKQVHVRPGDRIKMGQTLLELANDDLLLEKRRLESEVARHEQSYTEALSRQDRAQMAGLQSKVVEARAQLELVEQQLQRVTLVAPYDAIVIKGDLKEQLGAPVKRGDVLLTISPSNEFRVVVEVEERDVSLIQSSQRGDIALTALAQQAFAMQVERILPVASTAQGRTFFEVEAKIEKPDALLRPGMEGVARIDAQERSLAWILSHRLTDGLRLTLWSWGA